MYVGMYVCMYVGMYVCVKVGRYVTNLDFPEIRGPISLP